MSIKYVELQGNIVSRHKTQNARTAQYITDQVASLLIPRTQNLNGASSTNSMKVLTAEASANRA